MASSQVMASEPSEGFPSDVLRHKLVLLDDRVIALEPVAKANSRRSNEATAAELGKLVQAKTS